MLLGHFALAYAAKRPAARTSLGLGLWNSVPATIAVELLLFAGGLRLAGVAGGILFVALAAWVDRHRDPAV